jgi:Ca-activated chloride channel family protein
MKKSRYAKLCLTAALLLAAMISISLADGFIIVPPPYPRPTPGWQAFPLEVKYHNVDVEINETSASTSIDQEFYNPTGRRLDGYYIFPVPEGAAIDNFSVFINGKETEAEMLDAKKARAIYEDIVRRNIDPALLEYYRQGLFRVRVFPIEPHSTKRIKISYRQILAVDNGTVDYLYPLNTEKFSSRPLRDVVIRVTVASQAPVKNIYCPTHEVDIVYKSSRKAIVSYEAHEIKPDKDFELFFRTDRSRISLSVLTQKKPGESEGFFLLDISPEFNVKAEDIEEKDITFALDVSGSMSGEKLRQAKKAISFCIENLNKGDRFEIIRFSTEAEALFGDVVSATDENKQKALEFVRDLRAIGGTNIEDALKLVLRNKTAAHRPSVVLFITDGKPTIKNTNEDKLIDLVKKEKESTARIFTFGIGGDINTHLLDKITAATNAYRTYCTQDEDLEIKISNLYSKIQSPVMTNLRILADPNIQLVQIYPQELPDLFKGSSMTILGRYAGSGEAKIVLAGTVKDRAVRYESRCNFSTREEKNSFIAPLWAARKVGYLLDQIRLNGESKEIVNELVELGKRYGIITPYTSYLIVEDEERQVADRRLRRENQTLGFIAPPASASYEAAKRSYSAMREKSGSRSVSASEEVQAMTDAKNLAHSAGKGLAFLEAKGNTSASGSRMKKVLGRAMYLNGKYWIDPDVQKAGFKRTARIKYGTEDYFKILAEKPKAGEFYSLGKNVKFILDGTLYEVSDE